MILCPSCGSTNCTLFQRRGGVEEWECIDCDLCFALTGRDTSTEHPGAWS